METNRWSPASWSSASSLATWSSDEEDLKEFLRLRSDVQFIRVQWVDYSGVLRARFIPVGRCFQIANGKATLHLAQNSMIIPMSTAPKIFPLSDYHETWFLRPDWSSLRYCGFTNGHAAVMSFVDQKDAEARFDKCPRMLLAQALQRLKKDWAIDVVAGFEIEFVLLDSSDNVIEPMDRLNGYSRLAGLRADTLELVEDIVDGLKKSNINVLQFHTEVRDQLEIALAPEPALEAVDSLVLALEAVRATCVGKNLKASMTPKPTMTGPTNGLHLHLSLHGILDREYEDNFLAGVLSYMGSLCAFGMANYDGYVRSANDAAGAWIGFGTDNRDLPVRKINDWHWEFRIMDGTANPYLFVGAVLLAGLEGLEKKTELTWKDCKFFPDSMNESKRAEYGIHKRMPATFKEALDCLKSESSAGASELLKWYISVKDKEVEEFGKMTEEQRRRRFLEYF